jgi:cytochrome c peroxidase
MWATAAGVVGIATAGIHAARSTGVSTAATAPADSQGSPHGPALAALEPTPTAGSPELVQLGKMLFFDPRLSADGDMSCATCHQPAHAFTDGRPVAIGRRGQALARNTPTIVDLAGRDPYFWDGRAATIEEQATMPMLNPKEMAASETQVLSTLNALPEYVARFERAFPGSGVAMGNIARAIGTFERTVVTPETRVDQALRGDTSALSPQEALGMQLFVGKARCSRCHSGALYTDDGFHNIGVRGDDPGRYGVVPVDAARGAFRTPTLRDIAETAPYFHDGSAPTLESVVEHYDRGGDAKDGLDPEIVPLRLTPEEKAALVAFMQAFTAAPSPIDPPRLPQAGPRAGVASLRKLMSENDGMLGTVDRILDGLTAGDVARVRELAAKLMSNAERIDALAPRGVDRRRFRVRIGDLNIELGRFVELARTGNAAQMARSYQAVRGRCQACHDEFRKEGERP